MSNIRVLQNVLIVTGTYDDPTIRPYTTNLSSEGNAVELLREATHNGSIVTPGVIAGVAASVLTQSTNPEGIATIPNTWGDKRLRFFLELELNATNTTRNRQIITGYTDHVGFSSLTGSNVKFDPNMRIYINNTVLLRDSMFRDPSGATSYRTTVADDSQILRGGYAANMEGVIQEPQRTYGLRPEDLMGTQSANVHIMQRGGGGQIWDSRASMVQGPRKSHRDNGIASRFLSRCITALGQAYSNVDVDNEPNTAVFNQAFQAVQEQKMYADSFLTMLTNRYNYQQNGFVTWAQLVDLFPYLDDVSTLIRQGSTQQISEDYQRGQGEHWYGNGAETLFASRLVSAVPGLAIENMMSGVFFTATNRTVTGQFAVEFGHNSVQSFANGIDMGPWMARFEQLLVQEVLSTLTQNNLIDIDLDMHIQVAGETRIGIAIGGGNKVCFAVPSFCDSLFSPVMTLNPEAVNTIGSEIDRLVSFINIPAPNFGVGAGNPAFMGR